MREFRTYGSVRGAPGNARPYRDQSLLVFRSGPEAGGGSHHDLERRPGLRHRGTETRKLTQEQKIIRAKLGRSGCWNWPSSSAMSAKPAK